MLFAPEFMLAGVLTVALDLSTKRFVVARLDVGESVALAGGVSIRYLRNESAAPRSAAAFALLLVSLAAIAGGIAFLAHTGVFFQHAAAQAGLGAAIGGAAANLHDRNHNGAVVDFLSIGWWPPFNLADVGIVAGAGLAVIFVR